MPRQLTRTERMPGLTKGNMVKGIQGIPSVQRPKMLPPLTKQHPVPLPKQK